MSWNLQKTIIERLGAFEATAEYVVTDNVKCSLPFIRYGQTFSTQIGGKESRAYSERVQLDFFTGDDAGARTVRQMMDAVRDALSAFTPDLSPEWFCPDPPLETLAQVLTEYNEGKTIYHGILVYQYFTQKQ